MDELYIFSHINNKQIDKLVETYNAVSNLCESVRKKSNSLVQRNKNLEDADDQNRSIRRCDHAIAKMILEQEVTHLHLAINGLKSWCRNLSHEMDNPDSFIKEEDYDRFRDNSAGHGRTNRAITAYYLLNATNGIDYASNEILAEARHNLRSGPLNDISSIEERWNEIRSTGSQF